MPKKGGKRKKKRTHKDIPEDSSKKIPKSFIFKIGRVGKTVKELRDNLRKVMEPNTATHLQELKSNTMKDFIHVSGPLGVTHFLILSTTEIGTYLKLIKTPHGPTITFRIQQYSLIRDVLHMLKNPHSSFGLEYTLSPLVVLNGFSTGEDHLKLTSVMFQNMFPALNIATMKLEDCKRVLMIYYNKETKLIDLRHYFIQITPSGISRSIKRLNKAKTKKNGEFIPNLNKYQDISDYILGNTAPSESEAEDGPDNKINITNFFGNGKKISHTQQQSAVRLTEIGPRLTLSIIKIEEGFQTGRVIYHAYHSKTEQEILELEQKKIEKEKLKKQRKEEQESNIKKKEKNKELEENHYYQDNNESDEIKDDLYWYKKEVGGDIDPDELIETKKKKKFHPLYTKKKKIQENEKNNEKKVSFEINKKRKKDEIIENFKKKKHKFS